MLRLARLLAALSAIAAVAFPGAASAQQYPNRPVTLIVPWAAGGGTDAVARTVGTLLEKEFGQPVNVVNRTGGSGVVGHQAIAMAPPDGYTIGMITVETTMMHHQKLTEVSPASFTPLALMNLDPAGFHVRADSPYKNLSDALAAIKAAPAGRYKASGTGQGGIWHLALAGMLSDLKMDPAAVAWVPSQGAAPGLQDLVSGGVEFVPCSLPEARALIDAGKVRPLVIMDDKPSQLMPSIPTLKSATGSNWATGAWRGIAGPKGLPANVQERLGGALKRVYDSKEYRDFMAQRGFGMLWGNGEEFGRFMSKGDAEMASVMKVVGIVK